MASYCTIMDKLQAMHAFTRVVEAHSFSKAAETLQLPRGSVTRYVKDLESWLDTRLLHRTTRSIRVTPAGERFYEQCLGILGAVADVERVASDGGNPKGRVRIDLPTWIGRIIVLPDLDRFHARYPEVQLSISFNDCFGDLVSRGIDCSVRVGVLQDSRLVARRLGSVEMVTVASPTYLQRHGIPSPNAELGQHVAVLWSVAEGRIPAFQIADDRDGRQMPRSVLLVDDRDALLHAGVHGLGLVQVPRTLAYPHLQEGSLIEVPGLHPAPTTPVWMVMPQNKHLTAATRAFVSWLSDLISRYLGATTELATDPSKVHQISARPFVGGQAA